MINKNQVFSFVLLFLLPLSVQPIGLAVTDNGCSNLTLNSSEINSAGHYFDPSKDCSAIVHISGISQTTPWTLTAEINALSTGLPVKVAVDGGGFQYLSTTSEITLANGTGSTNSGLSVIVRIDQINAEDGYGDIINHANVLYRVVTE